MMKPAPYGIAVMAVVIGMAHMAMSETSVPKDGELALPAEYKSWPVFLKEVQKPDAIRDLYVNPVGARTAQGQMFPNGTQFVMEIYSAKKAADGAFEKDAAGKLEGECETEGKTLGRGAYRLLPKHAHVSTIATKEGVTILMIHDAAVG